MQQVASAPQRANEIQSAKITPWKGCQCDLLQVERIGEGALSQIVSLVITHKHVGSWLKKKSYALIEQPVCTMG